MEGSGCWLVVVAGMAERKDDMKEIWHRTEDQGLMPKMMW
jgi:hypothetical protein